MGEVIVWIIRIGEFMKQKTIIGVIILCLMVFFLVPEELLSRTSKEGGLMGSFRVGTSSATLNGTSTITGTPFKIKDNVGFLSIFYQATQGTSTPHYSIRVFTSYDGTNFTTLPESTATASDDETSTNLQHVSVAIPFCDSVRVDIQGIELNATNTTFNMWIGDQ